MASLNAGLGLFSLYRFAALDRGKLVLLYASSGLLNNLTIRQFSSSRNPFYFWM